MKNQEESPETLTAKLDAVGSSDLLGLSQDVFKSICFGDIPKTKISFSRAVMMAYICGQTSRDEDMETLKKALKKIIKMNKDLANEKYGDANRAESFSCVRVAREALDSFTERLAQPPSERSCTTLTDIN